MHVSTFLCLFHLPLSPPPPFHLPSPSTKCTHTIYYMYVCMYMYVCTILVLLTVFDIACFALAEREQGPDHASGQTH